MALLYSYAADCIFSVGLAFGPLSAGYLTEWTGNIMSVFYTALGCRVFFVLFLSIFVPESLTNERQLLARQKHQKSRGNLSRGPWRSTFANYVFFESLGILWPRGTGSSGAIRHNLVILVTIDTLSFGIGVGVTSIVILYADYMFGWSNLESSAFLSASNVSRMIALLMVLPAITRIVHGELGSRPHTHTPWRG